MLLTLLLISVFFPGGNLLQEKNDLGKINQQIREYQRELEDVRVKGDLYGEASILNKLGEAFHDSNRYKDALEYLDKALVIGKTLNSNDCLAETYMQRALLFVDWGDPDVARKNALEAKKLWDTSISPQNSARVLLSLSVINVSQGQYQDALDCYHEMLKLYRKLSDKQGEARALNGLGWTFFRIGDYRKALDKAGEALKLANEINAETIQKTALTTIIDSNLNLGDQASALVYAKFALDLSIKMGNSRFISYTYKQYGEIYFDIGDLEKSLEYYNKSLEITHEIENPYFESDLLIKIGLIHKIKGNQHVALKYFSDSLIISRSIKAPTHEINALHHIAIINSELGEFTEAHTTIEKGITLIESSRQQIGGRKDRETYFATVRKSYELFIHILMQEHKQNPDKGYLDTALQISESARARNLREMLTESHIDWKTNVPDDLLSQERTLNQKLNAIGRVIDKLIDKEKEDAEKELRKLAAEYDEVQRKIRLASPKYASITKPQPLKVAEMQLLLDKDTAMLEYALGDQRSYLFVITLDKITSYEIEGRSYVDRIATKVYEALTARQSQDVKENENFEQRIQRFKKADDTFWEEAKLLSEKIFTPVVNDLKQSKLIIVADGSLQYIPFAALPLVKPAAVSGETKEVSKNKENSDTKKIELIIDKYEISYLPSISALVELRKDSAERQTPDKSIAVVANPVFSRNDPRFQIGKGNGGGKLHTLETTTATITTDVLRAWKNVGGDKAIPSLPFSEKEGRDIFKLVPNKTGLLAIGFDARRSLIDSGELQKYRYLHFATHSLFNSEYPELSGLILSLYKLNGEREDGYLRLNDIYNMKLSADLVVLSACQTGIGKNVNGEGMIGLTRGFMYAGASRVVAGLWKVDDASTSRLMTKFYDGMFNEKLHPSAALRKAQLSVMRRADGQLMPPFYWAAFIQQGEFK